MLGNATSLVFGPAQFDQGLRDTGEWQADHVEVVAFDTRDVATGVPLDGVRAGFVVRLAGGQVTRDFFGGELREMHERGFNKAAALRVRKTNQRDAR